MTSQKYQSASIHLLEQARQELAAGDVRQASEKGWGAAAQSLKALCERREWPHRTHAALYRAIDRLVDETGDEEFFLLFRSANLLHVNFYEDMENARTVDSALSQVRRFIDKLDSLS